MKDDTLPALLLDEPSMMGVESIGVDTIKLQMVARTLPGKQFDVGRRLRVLVVSGLRPRRNRQRRNDRRRSLTGYVWKCRGEDDRRDHQQRPRDDRHDDPVRATSGLRTTARPLQRQ